MVEGGILIVWKEKKEINKKVEKDERKGNIGGKVDEMKIGDEIVKIMVMEIVLQVDQIIKDVGMKDEIEIMIIEVIDEVKVMMMEEDKLQRLIEEKKKIVMMEMGFILMIGMKMIEEGLGYNVKKGYIYEEMGLQEMVEEMNMMERRKRKER